MSKGDYIKFGVGLLGFLLGYSSQGLLLGLLVGGTLAFFVDYIQTRRWLKAADREDVERRWSHVLAEVKRLDDSISRSRQELSQQLYTLEARLKVLESR